MNLFRVLEWMRALWKGTVGRTSVEVADALLYTAHQMLSEDLQINRSMGAFGAKLLSNNMRIFPTAIQAL